MTVGTLDGITTRVHPGITGLKFVRECLASPKPLRNVLGHIIGNSFNDLAKLNSQGRRDIMVIAMFPDILSLRSSISGHSDIDLGLCTVPDEIKMESPPVTDTLLVTVVLQNSMVALSSRIWTDQQIFVRT